MNAWARSHPAIWSIRMTRHAVYEGMTTRPGCLRDEGIRDLHDALVLLDRMGERDAPLTSADVEQIPDGDLPGVLHRLLEYHRAPAQFTEAAEGSPKLADAIDHECIRVTGLVLARLKRAPPVEPSGSFVVIHGWQDRMIPWGELPRDAQSAAVSLRNIDVMRRGLA